MADMYRFNIPIEFRFTLKGEENPDLREKLRAECAKVIESLLREEPGKHLFAYPVEVDGHQMEVECWTGFLGTKHAPNRFRSRSAKQWSKIAQELIDRSKNDYGGDRHIKANLVRKADVPFYVGKWCFGVRAHLLKYDYITFRQEELLTHWHKEFKVKAELPEPPAPKKKVVKKKLTKAQKAWLAIASVDNEEEEVTFAMAGNSSIPPDDDEGPTF